MVTDLFLKADADVSPCNRYRYRLSRVWDESLVQACFVMLNPSTADATKDDPTIRRVIDFCRRWGLGGFVVVAAMPLEVFQLGAGWLFSTHPVTRVSLTDLEPTHDSRDRDYGWYKRHPGSTISGDLGELPAHIWDRLAGFDNCHEDAQGGAGVWKDYVTAQAARDALSAALVADGRERAGLPAL